MVAESLATSILAAATSIVESAQARMNPQPNHVTPLMPGSQPAFDAPEMGMLFGRLANVDKVERKDRAAARCDGVVFDVTLEFSAIRCAPTPSTGAVAVASAPMFDAALQALDDMEAIRQAVQDHEGATPKTWTPYPEGGGAHGGKWSVKVRLDLGGDC